MKKKALSLAVGAALVVGAAQQAPADQLLFPYFASGNGGWTFLSLRGDGTNSPPSANPLWYVFNYDDPRDGSCTHYDVAGAWTDYDLIQQTVLSPEYSGLNLTEDFGDASTPGYLPIAGPTEGFLTVLDGSAEGALGGQAIIVNANTGTVSAYRGINNPLSTPTVPGAGGDFSALGITSHRSHDFTWYPADVVDTAWFVLVTGTGMDNPAGWTGAVTLTNGFGGVFDRDEGFHSGIRNQRVVCYDVLTRGDLLNTAQQNATRMGGWGWFVSTNLTNGATGSLVYKIEMTDEVGGVITAISEENPFPNL